MMSESKTKQSDVPAPKKKPAAVPRRASVPTGNDRDQSKKLKRSSSQNASPATPRRGSRDGTKPKASPLLTPPQKPKQSKEHGPRRKDMKAFVIPRKAKEKDLLEEISVDSNSFQKYLLPAIVQQYRDPVSRTCYQYEKAFLVHNDKLEKEFQERRKELKEEGRTDKELAEQYAFLLVENMDVAKLICSDGLRVRWTGEAKERKLGHGDMGVYMNRYSDILSPVSLDTKKEHILLVLKLLKGKVKVVPFTNPSKAMEPTPKFESHVAKTAAVDGNRFMTFVSNQIYCYQFGDLDMAPRPQQVCPFALVHFTYTERQKESAVPGSPFELIQIGWVEKSREMMVSSSAYANKKDMNKEDGAKGTKKPPLLSSSYSTPITLWKGKLVNGGKEHCSAYLTSSRLPYLPVDLPRRLDLASALPVSKIRQVMPSDISKHPKLCHLPRYHEVSAKGRYFTYAQLRKSGDITAFAELHKCLKENQMALQKKVDNKLMFILPPCALTDELGIPKSAKSHILHALFISQKSTYKGLADIALNKSVSGPDDSRPPLPVINSKVADMKVELGKLFQRENNFYLALNEKPKAHTPARVPSTPRGSRNSTEQPPTEKTKAEKKPPKDKVLKDTTNSIAKKAQAEVKPNHVVQPAASSAALNNVASDVPFVSGRLEHVEGSFSPIEEETPTPPPGSNDPSIGEDGLSEAEATKKQPVGSRQEAGEAPDRPHFSHPPKPTRVFAPTVAAALPDLNQKISQLKELVLEKEKLATLTSPSSNASPNNSTVHDCQSRISELRTNLDKLLRERAGLGQTEQLQETFRRQNSVERLQHPAPQTSAGGPDIPLHGQRTEMDADELTDINSPTIVSAEPYFSTPGGEFPAMPPPISLNIDKDSTVGGDSPVHSPTDVPVGGAQDGIGADPTIPSDIPPGLMFPGTADVSTRELSTMAFMMPPGAGALPPAFLDDAANGPLPAGFGGVHDGTHDLDLRAMPHAGSGMADGSFGRQLHLVPPAQGHVYTTPVRRFPGIPPAPSADDQDSAPPTAASQILARLKGILTSPQMKNQTAGDSGTPSEDESAAPSNKGSNNLSPAGLTLDSLKSILGRIQGSLPNQDQPGMSSQHPLPLGSTNQASSSMSLNHRGPGSVTFTDQGSTSVFATEPLDAQNNNNNKRHLVDGEDDSLTKRLKTGDPNDPMTRLASILSNVTKKSAESLVPATPQSPPPWETLSLVHKEVPLETPESPPPWDQVNDQPEGTRQVTGSSHWSRNVVVKEERSKQLTVTIKGQLIPGSSREDGPTDLYSLVKNVLHGVSSDFAPPTDQERHLQDVVINTLHMQNPGSSKIHYGASRMVQEVARPLTGSCPKHKFLEQARTPERLAMMKQNVSPLTLVATGCSPGFTRFLQEIRQISSDGGKPPRSTDAPTQGSEFVSPVPTLGSNSRYRDRRDLSADSCFSDVSTPVLVIDENPDTTRELRDIPSEGAKTIPSENILGMPSGHALRLIQAAGNPGLQCQEPSKRGRNVSDDSAVVSCGEDTSLNDGPGAEVSAVVGDRRSDKSDMSISDEYGLPADIEVNEMDVQPLTSALVDKRENPLEEANNLHTAELKEKVLSLLVAKRLQDSVSSGHLQDSPQMPDQSLIPHVTSGSSSQYPPGTNDALACDKLLPDAKDQLSSVSRTVYEDQRPFADPSGHSGCFPDKNEITEQTAQNMHHRTDGFDVSDQGYLHGGTFAMDANQGEDTYNNNDQTFPNLMDTHNPQGYSVLPQEQTHLINPDVAVTPYHLTSQPVDISSVSSKMQIVSRVEEVITENKETPKSTAANAVTLQNPQVVDESHYMPGKTTLAESTTSLQENNMQYGFQSTPGDGTSDIHKSTEDLEVGTPLHPHHIRSLLGMDSSQSHHNTPVRSAAEASSPRSSVGDSLHSLLNSSLLPPETNATYLDQFEPTSGKPRITNKKLTTLKTSRSKSLKKGDPVSALFETALKSPVGVAFHGSSTKMCDYSEDVSLGATKDAVMQGVVTQSDLGEDSAKMDATGENCNHAGWSLHISSSGTEDAFPKETVPTAELDWNHEVFSAASGGSSPYSPSFPTEDAVEFPKKTVTESGPNGHEEVIPARSGNGPCHPSSPTGYGDALPKKTVAETEPDGNETVISATSGSGPYSPSFPTRDMDTFPWKTVAGTEPAIQVEVVSAGSQYVPYSPSIPIEDLNAFPKKTVAGGELDGNEKVISASSRSDRQTDVEITTPPESGQETHLEPGGGKNKEQATGKVDVATPEVWKMLEQPLNMNDKMCNLRKKYLPLKKALLSRTGDWECISKETGRRDALLSDKEVLCHKNVSEKTSQDSHTNLPGTISTPEILRMLDEPLEREKKMTSSRRKQDTLLLNKVLFTNKMNDTSTIDAKDPTITNLKANRSLAGREIRREMLSPIGPSLGRAETEGMESRRNDLMEAKSTVDASDWKSEKFAKWRPNEKKAKEKKFKPKKIRRKTGGGVKTEEMQMLKTLEELAAKLSACSVKSLIGQGEVHGSMTPQKHGTVFECPSKPRSGVSPRMLPFKKDYTASLASAPSPTILQNVFGVYDLSNATVSVRQKEASNVTAGENVKQKKGTKKVSKLKNHPLKAPIFVVPKVVLRGKPVQHVGHDTARQASKKPEPGEDEANQPSPEFTSSTATSDTPRCRSLEPEYVQQHPRQHNHLHHLPMMLRRIQRPYWPLFSYTIHHQYSYVPYIMPMVHSPPPRCNYPLQPNTHCSQMPQGPTVDKTDNEEEKSPPASSRNVSNEPGVIAPKVSDVSDDDPGLDLIATNGSGTSQIMEGHKCSKSQMLTLETGISETVAASTESAQSIDVLFEPKDTSTPTLPGRFQSCFKDVNSLDPGSEGCMKKSLSVPKIDAITGVKKNTSPTLPDDEQVETSSPSMKKDVSAPTILSETLGSSANSDDIKMNSEVVTLQTPAKLCSANTTEMKDEEGSGQNASTLSSLIKSRRRHKHKKHGKVKKTKRKRDKMKTSPLLQDEILRGIQLLRNASSSISPRKIGSLSLKAEKLLLSPLNLEAISSEDNNEVCTEQEPLSTLSTDAPSVDEMSRNAALTQQEEQEEPIGKHSPIDHTSARSPDKCELLQKHDDVQSHVTPSTVEASAYMEDNISDGTLLAGATPKASQNSITDGFDIPLISTDSQQDYHPVAHDVHPSSAVDEHLERTDAVTVGGIDALPVMMPDTIDNSSNDSSKTIIYGYPIEDDDMDISDEPASDEDSVVGLAPVVVEKNSRDCRSGLSEAGEAKPCEQSATVIDTPPEIKMKNFVLSISKCDKKLDTPRHGAGSKSEEVINNSSSQPCPEEKDEFMNHSVERGDHSIGDEDNTPCLDEDLDEDMLEPSTVMTSVDRKLNRDSGGGPDQLKRPDTPCLDEDHDAPRRSQSSEVKTNTFSKEQLQDCVKKLSFLDEYMDDINDISLADDDTGTEEDIRPNTPCLDENVADNIDSKGNSQPVEMPQDVLSLREDNLMKSSSTQADKVISLGGKVQDKGSMTGDDDAWLSLGDDGSMDEFLVKESCLDLPSPVSTKSGKSSNKHVGKSQLTKEKSKRKKNTAKTALKKGDKITKKEGIKKVQRMKNESDLSVATPSKRIILSKKKTPEQRRVQLKSPEVVKKNSRTVLVKSKDPIGCLDPKASKQRKVPSKKGPAAVKEECDEVGQQRSITSIEHKSNDDKMASRKGHLSQLITDRTTKNEDLQLQRNEITTGKTQRKSVLDRLGSPVKKSRRVVNIVTATDLKKSGRRLKNEGGQARLQKRKVEAYSPGKKYAKLSFLPGSDFAGFQIPKLSKTANEKKVSLSPVTKDSVTLPAENNLETTKADGLAKSKPHGEEHMIMEAGDASARGGVQNTVQQLKNIQMIQTPKSDPKDDKISPCNATNIRPELSTPARQASSWEIVDEIGPSPTFVKPQMQLNTDMTAKGSVSSKDENNNLRDIIHILQESVPDATDKCVHSNSEHQSKVITGVELGRTQQITSPEVQDVDGPLPGGNRRVVQVVGIPSVAAETSVAMPKSFSIIGSPRKREKALGDADRRVNDIPFLHEEDSSSVQATKKREVDDNKMPSAADTQETVKQGFTEGRDNQSVLAQFTDKTISASNIFDILFDDSLKRNADHAKKVEVSERKDDTTERRMGPSEEITRSSSSVQNRLKSLAKDKMSCPAENKMKSPSKDRLKSPSENKFKSPSKDRLKKSPSKDRSKKSPSRDRSKKSPSKDRLKRSPSKDGMKSPSKDSNPRNLRKIREAMISKHSSKGLSRGRKRFHPYVTSKIKASSLVHFRRLYIPRMDELMLDHNFLIYRSEGQPPKDIFGIPNTAPGRFASLGELKHQDSILKNTEEMEPKYTPEAVPSTRRDQVKTLDGNILKLAATARSVQDLLDLDNIVYRCQSGPNGPAKPSYNHRSSARYHPYH